MTSLGAIIQGIGIALRFQSYHAVEISISANFILEETQFPLISLTNIPQIRDMSVVGEEWVSPGIAGKVHESYHLSQISIKAAIASFLILDGKYERI